MLERAKDVTGQVVSQIEEARRRRTAPLILELDLTEPLVEGVPHDPMSALMARRKTPLRAVLDGLERAGPDPRVRALVVRLGGARSPLTLARAQELRDAIASLRHHDTLTVAWAETFGEPDRGSVPYYLAAGFDEVWLQPSGGVGLTGLAAQTPFLRGALDKAGITPEVVQRHEYKNAANIFTEQGFTDAHREATEHLVGALTDQLVAGIAEGRGLDAAEVRTLVDRAPLFAGEALDARLVDHLGYRDQVYASVRQRIGDDAVLLYVGRYARSSSLGAGAKAGAGPLAGLTELTQRMGGARPDTVALVHVTGPIHLGKTGRQPFGRPSAGADTVTGALRAAAEAPDVKAVVLRVDSPGGGHVASDSIWRQVALTRQAGTPVVVSMGSVAASGGYFVSMGADAVLAQPATITGSIGVVAGKPVIDGLVERLGIGHEGVAGGRHSLMFSPLQGFTPDEWERMNAWLDHIYDDFVAKVAERRGLPLERVQEIARGRVWTGADARELGLVDDLGGLRAAVEVAKERAGLPAAAEPELVTYPRTPLVARLRPATSSEDPAAAATRLGAGLGLDFGAWGSLADLAARLGLPAHGPLTLPDLHLT